MNAVVWIETARLILRTVTMADIDAVASSWKLDAGPIPLSDAEKQIERCPENMWILRLMTML